MPQGVFLYGRPAIKFTQETLNQMCQLYTDGWAISEIAKELKTSQMTVVRRLRASGITLRNRGMQSERARAKYSGEKHPGWKGGRMLHGSTGYWLTRCPSHPHQRGGYILEHRFVMECHLQATNPNHPAMHDGYLKLTYVVHHKNGDKADNRIENLEVMPKGKHSSWIHYMEQIEALKIENARLRSLLVAHNIA